MEPYIPCPSWLSSFCKSHNIVLKDPETLEDARKKYCNRVVINDFFRNNAHFLQGIKPQLLFNADETTSITTKKFKALSLKRTNMSTISIPKTEPHVTSLLCYNACGYRLKPFIILPAKKKLPQELHDMNAFFCSQKAGWMSKQLFSAFAIFFATSINLYRLELPIELRSETVILLVDNHISRCNAYAAEFLRLHNIRLVTFPAHCTHVLQPFDVGAAASFKLNLSSFKFSKSVIDSSKKLQKEAARVRYLTVSSIINAWNSIPNEVLKISFEASGIYPFNPEIPLNNRFTNQTSTFPGPERHGRINITNKELTSDINRIQLFNYEFNTNFTNVNQIPKPKYSNIYSVLTIPNPTKGFILSKFPALLVKEPDGSYQTITM